MPMPIVQKKRRKVLSDGDKQILRRARTQARGNADWTPVPSHKRKQYRLVGYAARLSSWDRLEHAAYTLCSNIERLERRGILIDSDDRRRATALTLLLQDAIPGNMPRV